MHVETYCKSLKCSLLTLVLSHTGIVLCFAVAVAAAA